MNKLVSPLTGAASGFPEYTPAQQRAFDAAIAKVKTVYESFGFTPLETGAIEKISTLESKGISSKEIYGLRRLNVADDNDGAKDVALRFDLTVPLARYVTVNQAQLVFPFRRYQVQPVWRGERAQAGRYRQFHQFDIDTIGDGSLPITADAEIIAAGVMALETLGVGEFTVMVNNRRLLEGLLRWAKAKDITAAIKAIDDAEKVGWPTTQTLLEEKAGISAKTAKKLCDLLQQAELDAADIPADLDNEAKAGLADLKMVAATAQTLLPRRLRGMVKAELSIARGLDYYTGTVVETRLENAPDLGSVMSGGRYDNLADNLGKKKMPGVGISIGISRLTAYLLTLPAYQLPPTPAQLLIACADDAHLTQLAALAQELRAEGVNVELSLASGKGLGQQLQTAEKRGIAYAITKLDGDRATLRHLPTRSDQILPRTRVAVALK